MLLRISPAIYASMWPSLLENDLAVCQYFLFGRGRKTVTRNDIVAFVPPSVDGTRSKAKADYHVKRVIGLPGDRVEVVPGVGVFVNGRMLNEQNYVANKAEYSLKCLGDIGGMMAPGESVRPFFGSERAADPILVPAKHFFLLGDNRNVSTDSHIYGFIREDMVRARLKSIRYRKLEAKSIMWNCSFCQRTETKVKYLLQGLGGYICNECLDAVYSSSAQIPEQTARCTLCLEWRDALSIQFSERAAAGRACTACVKTAMGAYHERLENGSVQGKPLDFAANISRSATFLRFGDYERALTFARAAETQNKDDLRTTALLSQALLKLGRIDEAVEVAQRAASVDDQKASTKLLLVSALIAAGQIDEAHAACMTVLERHPASPEALGLRSVILIKQGKWADALTDARKVLSEDPDSAEMHANCAYALLELGEVDKALVSTDRALYCNVRLPQAYRTRGRVRMAKELYSLAVEDFTRAILLSPTSGEFFAYRASAYEKLGEKSLAEADLHKARELGWHHENAPVM